MKQSKKNFRLCRLFCIFLLSVSCDNNSNTLLNELSYLKADKISINNSKVYTNDSLSEFVEISLNGSPLFEDNHQIASLHASRIAYKTYKQFSLLDEIIKIKAVSKNNRVFEFEYLAETLKRVEIASKTNDQFFSLIKEHDFEKISDITIQEEGKTENPFVTASKDLINDIGELKKYTFKGWEYHKDFFVEKLGKKVTIIQYSYQIEHTKEIYDNVSVEVAFLSEENIKILAIRYKK